MKRPSCLVLTLMLLMSTVASSGALPQKALFTPGTYETEAQGFGVPAAGLSPCPWVPHGWSSRIIAEAGIIPVKLPWICAAACGAPTQFSPMPRSFGACVMAAA